MTLLAANELNFNRFFESGDPFQQASSFDLTIGTIYDKGGKEILGPYILEPGHMVQVVSQQVFNLPDNITGHVTYKTGLTSKGIWALTVGIVDPGWNGPIATTLLNFSKVPYAIHKGDRFLRVSFFEHQAIQENQRRKSYPLSQYLKEIQSSAATRFPSTFLDTEAIARGAGETAVNSIRNRSVIWLGALAIVFAFFQLTAAWFHPDRAAELQRTRALEAEVQSLQQRLDDLEDLGVRASPEVNPLPSNEPAQSQGVAPDDG
jgi:deoxycytidine triphosphate deaminase